MELVEIVCEEGKEMALAPVSSSVTTSALVMLNLRTFLIWYFRFSQLGIFIYNPIVGMFSCGRDLKMGVTCSL